MNPPPAPLQVMHMLVQRSAEYEEPVRSKDPVVVHAGFRCGHDEGTKGRGGFRARRKAVGLESKKKGSASGAEQGGAKGAGWV